MVRTDADYLRYDPFEGDRDVDIRCRTLKIVTVRKQQKCHGLDRESHGHEIEVGGRARYEQAIVDGKWGRCYVCTECMDKWLDEFSPGTTGGEKDG